MKKCIIFFLVCSMLLLGACSNTTNLDTTHLIDTLTEHLISSNYISDGLTTEDGSSLEWIFDEMRENAVNESECLIIDLRYSSDTESVMAGRLFGSYAISKDGKKAFWYRADTDLWETIPQTVGSDASGNETRKQ